MPISLDCLIQATLPWIVPSPVNGGPLVRHLIQKVAASRFGLSIKEGPTFDLCWKIYEGAHSIQKAFDAEIRSERSAAFSRIANIVAGRATYQQRGYRHVARLEDDRPYVIFSDHHVAHAGHRQDFFAASGNRELYQDVLSEYASSEYVLVENGDVEELLIPEPTIAEASVRAELAGAGDIDHPLGRTWQAYDDY